MDSEDRSFDWWAAALNGIRGQISPDDPPKSGFYRLKNMDGTHSAAAYWYDQTDESHGLRCQIDGKDVPDDRARDQWTFACKGPIPEDVYWRFIENHTWLDIDPSDMQRKPFVIAVDLDQAFQQFRSVTDVAFLLKRLAQDAVNKGHEVPGATIEWREVIKRGVIKKQCEMR